MFKDYYKILDVVETATANELKQAFKRQALKWHPDQNTGQDTTLEMQEINEAYLILKDTEARERYDREYQQFKKNQRDSPHSTENRKPYNNQNENYNEEEYFVHDEILSDWIKNAQRQSIDLAKKTIDEMRLLLGVGVKAFVHKFLSLAVTGLIIGGVLMLLSKGCN